MIDQLLRDPTNVDPVPAARRESWCDPIKKSPDAEREDDRDRNCEELELAQPRRPTDMVLSGLARCLPAERAPSTDARSLPRQQRALWPGPLQGLV